jgi:hypothetical protein
LTGGLVRSNEYISSLFPEPLPRSRRAAVRQQVWGEFFGLLIQGVREKLGRSSEEAARLAGITASEWEAMKTGRVPQTREQLAALAGALEIDWSGMASLALLCRQAWRR